VAISGVGLLPLLSQGQACCVPRNDKRGVIAQPFSPVIASPFYLSLRAEGVAISGGGEIASPAFAGAGLLRASQ